MEGGLNLVPEKSQAYYCHLTHSVGGRRATEREGYSLKGERKAEGESSPPFRQSVDFKTKYSSPEVSNSTTDVNLGN